MLQMSDKSREFIRASLSRMCEPDQTAVLSRADLKALRAVAPELKGVIDLVLVTHHPRISRFSTKADRKGGKYDGIDECYRFPTGADRVTFGTVGYLPVRESVASIEAGAEREAIAISALRAYAPARPNNPHRAKREEIAYGDVYDYVGPDIRKYRNSHRMRGYVIDRVLKMSVAELARRSVAQGMDITTPEDRKRRAQQRIKRGLDVVRGLLMASATPRQLAALERVSAAVAT